MTLALNDPGFVHLHTHTSFSLREGALTIAKLTKLAAADRMPALAITDTNNLFGALEFSEKLAKEGIQPIVGLHVSVDFADAAALGARNDFGRAGRASVVLLSQSEAGYTNLMRLASQAFLDPEPGEPAGLSLARLAHDSAGLIALTGGPTGPLDGALRLDRAEAAAARLERLLAIFGPDHLYIELQRHGLESERQVEPQLIDLAYRRDIRLVATNEPFFAGLGDHEAHDALICIAEGAAVGTPDRRRLTPEHRFKPRAEMVTLFKDLPEATANTVEIARRCHHRPRTRKPILPPFTTLDGTPLDADLSLRQQAEAGLAVRIEAHGMAPGFTTDDYQRRLAFELDVIVKMQFPGYFLIVSDFIKWAKGQDIPVGPGRGSGAGSLVAYALTITDLDPMRFALLFERFLNPERVSMPDFDIDFCQDRREEVIAYVRERYGRDRVAQIITFGSFLARGVLRNVGRVLEMSFGQVDKLAKLVPQNPANPVTLAQAIEGEPKLREAADEDPKVRNLLQIAGSLEGLYSNASTHAAGIVIGDRPLHEIVPLYRDPKSDMPATQFNMKWVEPAGLVKFDFLGLKTLTVLNVCIKLIALRGIALDLSALPLDDAKTYAMLGRGETVGVFQVESAGMRKALVEMKADRFEDIIALVALYRPGPMANIPVYCARKLGEEEPVYIHEKLEPVLKETFGVIIYQEQVMQAAQVLSGYSLGEADMLRRAMGKKIKAEMDAQRERFVDGCIRNEIPKAKADEIFDMLAKFADYGFNKSHAAAYALISYQTAYLKANFPVEFLAASMTLDKNNTDKLSEFRNEAQRLGIKVEAPSVNQSGVDFEVPLGGAPAIRYALSALKGAGEGQMKAIVKARGGTPFAGLDDFARRVSPRDVNKKALETLVAAGAFDTIEADRAKVFAATEAMLALANRTADELLAGQSALFGNEGASALRLPKVAPWSQAERLRREFDAIGFFLSGHPLDEYKDVLVRMRAKPWAQVARSVKVSGAASERVAATVLDRQERRTKSGNKIGIVEMSDPTGQFEAILFSEALNDYRDLLEKGTAVLVTLQATADGDEIRARILTVERLDEAAARVQKGLRIHVGDAEALPIIAKSLQTRGDREISIVIDLANQRRAEVRLRDRFQVSAEVTSQLKATAGILAVDRL
ncbi:DNA polymerase III subunit alpha [Lichenihabitans sp. Uapishka_5]|uniref:DNA polymerase III subunit alpha n=1 Tax=Lichenihabitans sp. Uapishka_5 TaxID=3037302 RepID=UPI0029E7CFDE|nr:DNA polymerase III subunit alpha [Lichenihabitans sp. Uapishka_5]MDX7950752.1 DNA polymerase III subunit alpha [Lichenihabitans sp. Uapishka_5]